MTTRGCKYSAGSFCYVYREFFAKRAKKHCLNNCIRAGEAYLAYFGMPVGDQDKRWAPHVIYDYCRRTLEGLREEKRAIRFAIPRIWREPLDHHTNFAISVWWIQQNEEREGMHLPSSILAFHRLLHLFLRITLTCLCHSHPQEVNLVQQRQVLKIPKRRVRHHQHLLCVVHADWGIKDVPITLIKKTSMTSLVRWH